MDPIVDDQTLMGRSLVSEQKKPFAGTSLYAIKRKAKRLGWCLNCYREECPGLIAHNGTSFKVYYCYKRQFKSKQKKILVEKEDWIL